MGYEGENTVMQWAGWTTCWDPEEREAVQEHHREYYDELKSEIAGHSTPVKDIPGLLNGIESLLRYGYSLVDIGAMLGLTRERVRQIANEHDLERPYKNGAQYRVWNDEEDRFEPVPPEEMQERAKKTYRRKREREKRHEKALRWNRTITVIRDLSGELGRPPTSWEVAHRLFPDRDLPGATAYITVVDRATMGGTRNGRSRSEVWGELYRLAGVEQPSRGAPGHREYLSRSQALDK